MSISGPKNVDISESSYKFKYILTEQTLLEYEFTFNFCQVVLDNFGFKVRLDLRYVNKLAETSVKENLNFKIIKSLFKN